MKQKTRWDRISFLFLYKHNLKKNYKSFKPKAGIISNAVEKSEISAVLKQSRDFIAASNHKVFGKKDKDLLTRIDAILKKEEL